MTVSVIIPNYNNALYITECISSVYAQQGGTVLEVIVVDDGSTDGSWELLHKLKSEVYPELQILSHAGRANKGPSISRMLGTDHATGRYVAFLDADDVFLDQQKLLKQIDIISRSQTIGLVHTGVSTIGDSAYAKGASFAFNTSIPSVYNFRSLRTYLLKNCICNSSVLVETSLLRTIDYGFTQMFQYEDWALWILLSECCDFAFIDKRMTGYRCHAESATSYVVGSNLRQCYSLLEMKLILLSRSRSSFYSIKVVLSILKTLLFLYSHYVYSSAAEPKRSSQYSYFSRLLAALGHKINQC